MPALTAASFIRREAPVFAIAARTAIKTPVAAWPEWLAELHRCGDVTVTSTIIFVRGQRERGRELQANLDSWIVYDRIGNIRIYNAETFHQLYVQDDVAGVRYTRAARDEQIGLLRFRQRPPEVSAIRVEDVLKLAKTNPDKLPPWIRQEIAKNAIAIHADHVLLNKPGALHDTLGVKATPDMWLLIGEQYEKLCALPDVRGTSIKLITDEELRLTFERA